MTERYEFGSPEWLQATCNLIESWLEESKVDLTGLTYISGEQFTNVPTRLNPTGRPTVGWTLYIRDGVVSTIAEPPPPDANSDIVGDWDAVERLAQMAGSDDPEVIAARQRQAAELEAAGKLQRILRGERPAALVEAFGAGFLQAVHAFTGPRQG